MSTNGHAPRVGDYRRLETERADLLLRVAALNEKLARAEDALRHRLTPAQARNVLDENERLRRVNEALVRRNTILVDKLKP